VLVFDERLQVHVVVPLNDEDALARVTAGVWMLEDVEQVARSIWKTIPASVVNASGAIHGIRPALPECLT
jgi:hypothetical protein